MATFETQSDLVPARRRAGAGTVLIAPSDTVVQPCAPCDCHASARTGAPWHPGQVALVRRGELEGITWPDGSYHEGRDDVEPLSADELAAYEAALAAGSAPHEAVMASAPFGQAASVPAIAVTETTPAEIEAPADNVSAFPAA